MKYRILSFHHEKIFEVSFSNNSHTYSRLEDISNLEKNKSLELCQLIGSFFDFMPGHVRGRSLHQLPAWIWKRADCFPQELTFYGGSFHPWHLGHDACLKLHPEPGSLLVLPDNNPWKDEKRSYCHWTFFKTLALSYKNTDYSFYPGFLGMEEKNPTAAWFLRAIVRDKSLLMGEDSFQSFSKWYDIEKLLMVLKKIYIVPRLTDNPGDEEGMKFIYQNAPHIELIKLQNHPYEHLSSSELRKNLN